MDAIDNMQVFLTSLRDNQDNLSRNLSAVMKDNKVLHKTIDKLSERITLLEGRRETCKS